MWLRRCEPFAIDPLYIYDPSAGNGTATNFVPDDCDAADHRQWRADFG